MWTHKQGYEPEEFWYWASTDGDDNDNEVEDYEVNKFTASIQSYCYLFFSLRIHLLPSTTTYVPPIITASGVE